MRNRYYKNKKSVINLQGQKIEFISGPIIPDWKSLSSLARLLAKNVEIAPDSRVLMIGCGYGALGVFLAKKAFHGSVILTDTSIVSLNTAKITLKHNRIENASAYAGVSLPPEFNGTFDIVVVLPPKGRNLRRRLLLEAYKGLKRGGKLYLAGEKRQGVKSLIGDAEELFENAAIIDIRSRERVAVLIRRSQDMPEIPWLKIAGVLPGSWHKFQTEIRGHSFTIRSLPGVFSYDRIDDGTRLLLDHLEVVRDSTVLDIGCGYGIIGLMASKLGAGRVDLVDADLLALESARENTRKNNIKNIRIIPGDLIEPVAGEKYDLIVSNPPFHTGVSTNYDIARVLIEDAKSVLAPGGKILLVANAFLKYDRYMKDVFGNSRVVFQTDRYHLALSELPE
jgi:16S rRNA (guanine1207-N2)-methyltransferase